MITALLVSAAMSQSATVSGTVMDGGKPVSEAVVWLSGAAKGKPMKASIVQKGKQFLPHILVVTTGSTVDFPNRDDLFHNVFAEFNAKKFDLGMYPKGQSRKVVFDKPGVVSILCNVHSNMSAYVMVVDSPYFAKTDKSGKFSISGVASGRYVGEAWHESGKKGRADVTVSGGAASVSFKISRR